MPTRPIGHLSPCTGELWRPRSPLWRLRRQDWQTGRTDQISRSVAGCLTTAVDIFNSSALVFVSFFQVGWNLWSCTCFELAVRLPSIAGITSCLVSLVMYDDDPHESCVESVKSARIAFARRATTTPMGSWWARWSSWMTPSSCSPRSSTRGRTAELSSSRPGGFQRT